jgi:hypothetical protein
MDLGCAESASARCNGSSTGWCRSPVFFLFCATSRSSALTTGRTALILHGFAFLFGFPPFPSSVGRVRFASFLFTTDEAGKSSNTSHFRLLFGCRPHFPSSDHLDGKANVRHPICRVLYSEACRTTTISPIVNIHPPSKKTFLPPSVTLPRRNSASHRSKPPPPAGSRRSEGVHRGAGVISGSACRRRSYTTILGSRWTSARCCQCSLVKFPGRQVRYQPNPISTASTAISTRGVRQRDQEHGLRLCLLRTKYLFCDFCEYQFETSQERPWRSVRHYESHRRR